MIFLWLFGFAFGAVVVYALPGSSVSLMRDTLLNPASLIGSSVAVFIPFLLSIVFLSFSNLKLYFAAVFAKAFSFGFVLCGIKLLFGGAGWLVLLALFSDIFATPVLLLFWLRNISFCKKLRQSDVFVTFAILVCILLIDACVVTPFLAGLSFI